MMRLTVKELRHKIKGLLDETEVCIERIPDIYFTKYGWETDTVVFIDDSYVEYFNATQSQVVNDKLIIFGHY
jgi:hypothetical protein